MTEFQMINGHCRLIIRFISKFDSYKRRTRRQLGAAEIMFVEATINRKITYNTEGRRWVRMLALLIQL